MQRFNFRSHFIQLRCLPTSHPMEVEVTPTTIDRNAGKTLFRLLSLDPAKQSIHTRKLETGDYKDVDVRW